MSTVTVVLVVNPTHYKCRGCGYRGKFYSFPYLPLSTVLCCPVCSGTDLMGIRVFGDGSVVEESGS